MAGSMLNSSSVFQLNFSAKLNICASISATSPSCKTLAVSHSDDFTTDYFQRLFR